LTTEQTRTHKIPPKLNFSKIFSIFCERICEGNNIMIEDAIKYILESGIEPAKNDCV
jgi:hypothetical protein